MREEAGNVRQMLLPNDSAAVLAPLRGWFSEFRRKLPWRAENLDLPHPDPYAVLVSELMLQQTQVATVIPYFNRWMSRFPNPRSLAEAGDDEVHKYWEGLGYYRRARYLKQTAVILTMEGWPKNLDGFLALPGMGPYTAAAVAAIAFQWPEPALDGNAFRVLARILNIPDDARLHAKALRIWLRPALEAHGPSWITQAIMELGATLCSPRPSCARCPLATYCEAYRLGITDRVPPVKTRAAVQELDLWLVAIQAEGHWLLVRPTDKGLLSGLWRWPSHPVESSQMAAENSLPYHALEQKAWKGWTQVYSHRKERIHPIALVFPQKFPAPSRSAWVSTSDLPSLPLGKRDQRMQRLLDEGRAELPANLPSNVIQRILMGLQDPPLTSY